MPRAFAAIIVVMMCLNATAAAGCDEDLHLADRTSGVHTLQNGEGGAESDANCCADCYCCARVLDNACHATERTFLPTFCQSDRLTVRLVDGHITPPYHPPQTASQQ
jgi:hypothetical protein